MLTRRHGPCCPFGRVRDFLFPRILRAVSIVTCIAALSPVWQGCTEKNRQAEPSTGTALSQSEKISYIDGIGRRVALPKHPTRIISLAPSVTEDLYLLGAQDRLIGVTTQCDWPEAAQSKPKIGDLLNPNYEVILAAKPDLIIASTAGNDRSAILKLSDFGLPVFVTAPRSTEKIFETVRQIGQITDCSPQASALLDQMENRLKNIERRLAGLPITRAFFITWFEPLLAPGGKTFENDILRLAGVTSISADIDDYYPRYSLEQVITQAPDVILSVEHPGNLLPDLRRVSGWKNLRAVREGRIYLLNPVIQHPSPRFVDGVEELARKLHPERF